jgi:hypothetical protein
VTQGGVAPDQLNLRTVDGSVVCCFILFFGKKTQPFVLSLSIFFFFLGVVNSLVNSLKN